MEKTEIEKALDKLEQEQKERHMRRNNPQLRTKATVLATGNRWAIENFRAVQGW